MDQKHVRVFGLHRSGPGGRRPPGQPAALVRLSGKLRRPGDRGAGGDPDAVFFLGLACRQVWQIHWDIVRDELSFHGGARRGDFDAPGERHFALMRAYKAVVAVMDRRTLLPGSDGGIAGVLYTDDAGSPAALWAAEDLTLPLPEDLTLPLPEDLTLPLPEGLTVHDVLTGEDVPAAGMLRAADQHVYRFGLKGDRGEAEGPVSL